MRPPVDPALLLELWLAMLAASGGDPAAFRSAQEVFTKTYKRADYAEQGEFHWRLAADHRRWAAAA